jgi:hypothetical protein
VHRDLAAHPAAKSAGRIIWWQRLLDQGGANPVSLALAEATIEVAAGEERGRMMPAPTPGAVMAPQVASRRSRPVVLAQLLMLVGAAIAGGWWFTHRDGGDGVTNDPTGTGPAATSSTMVPVPTTLLFAPEWGAFGSYPTAEKSTLSNGSSGDEVRYLQGVLAVKAHATLKVDGNFGEETMNVVIAFQGINGLPATGIVDDATWAKIDEAALQP